MTAEQLREYITTHTGHAPTGTPEPQDAEAHGDRGAAQQGA